MGKRIVIALGGNALGKNLEEQMHAVKTTASAIADLIEDGHEVVIAHGNGPQVGMIQNAFAAYHKQQAKSDIMPLSMCVAMSQGYIGYDLQNMIGEELDCRGLGIHCATVLTQVAVDPADPAFQHPTKPIGAFMTEEEAKKLAADVEANLNPAKWVCVEAEKTAVLVHNCTVLLVMSWSDVTDALTANFNALWS